MTRPIVSPNKLAAEAEGRLSKNFGIGRLYLASVIVWTDYNCKVHVHCAIAINIMQLHFPTTKYVKIHSICRGAGNGFSQANPYYLARKWQILQKAYTHCENTNLKGLFESHFQFPAPRAKIPDQIVSLFIGLYFLIQHIIDYLIYLSTKDFLK